MDDIDNDVRSRESDDDVAAGRERRDVISLDEKATAGHRVKEEDEVVTYPEGGYGWVVVASSAAIFFTGWGQANAWGTFQTYYETVYPHTSPAVISLIGSLQMAMIEGTGVIVGALLERFGLRKVMVAGATLQVGALLATSFARTVWQLYLAQGLAFGLGAGTLYIVAVSVPGQWFHRKKATAYGVLYMSSGLGGIIWPIALARLLPRIGYGWTMRVILFVSLALILAGCCFIREREIARPPSVVVVAAAVPGSTTTEDEKEVAAKSSQASWAMYTDVNLWYISAGYFIISVGVSSPMYFIGTFAKTVGMSDHLASYLLAMLNASSIFGRTVTGIMADRYGRINVLLLSILSASLTQLLLWTSVRTNAGVIALALLYGWFFGGLISLMPALSAQVLGQENLSAKFGVVSAMGGAGQLLGAPVAALWIGDTRASYLGTILFSGGFVLASGLLFLYLRLRIDRRMWVVL